MRQAQLRVGDLQKQNCKIDLVNKCLLRGYSMDHRITGEPRQPGLDFRELNSSWGERKKARGVWLEQRGGQREMRPRWRGRAQGTVGLAGSERFRFYSEQNGKERREDPWSPQSCRGRKGTLESSPYELGFCEECRVPLRGWGAGVLKEASRPDQVSPFPPPRFSSLFTDTPPPSCSSVPTFFPYSPSGLPGARQSLPPHLT